MTLQSFALKNVSLQQQKGTYVDLMTTQLTPENRPMHSDRNPSKPEKQVFFCCCLQV